MDLRDDGTVSIGDLTVQRNPSFLTVVPNTVSGHEIVESSIHQVAEDSMRPPTDSLNDDHSHDAFVLGNHAVPQTLNSSISSGATPVIDVNQSLGLRQLDS